MQNHKKTTAFVVATKDRPHDLRKMLQSLSDQSHRPDQIVIVDSSAASVIAVTKEFPELNIKYIHHTPPSASAQRNRGIRLVEPNIELIGFLDDDIVLAPNAIQVMLKFWQIKSTNLGGCAFNLMNPPPRGVSRLKESALSRLIGLYSDEKGVVMPSGWQTMTGTVEANTFVEWLPTTAAAWKKKVFENFQFDEFFDGYSYLEDLDFSYSVSRHYKLAIAADAKFWHYPSPAGRISYYRFGRIEVRNRIYIVRKHHLSLTRCYLGIIVRLLMTIQSALFQRKKADLERAIGNVVGALQSLKNTQKRTPTI